MGAATSPPALANRPVWLQISSHQSPTQVPIPMAHVPEALANAMQDRYRLERELGAGGMATVYLAHDLRHAS